MKAAAGRTLVAGPYAGEFGWEVAAWVPRMRRAARDFSRVVVLTRASSAPLYEFASRVVPIEVVPGTSNFVQGELAAPPPAVRGDLRLEPSADLVRLEEFAFRAPDSAAAADVESAKAWHRYGRAGAPRIDVALALRPAKLFAGRLDATNTYPADRADALAAKLTAAGLRVGCIGGPESGLAAGALDLRALPLRELFDVLASARLALGPSSGPLHLAQLCGCPVLAWYAAQSPSRVVASRVRYARLWNPFRTAWAHLGGVPSASAAADAALELLER